jgi:ureidoacrylate peracid hydrolase
MPTFPIVPGRTGMLFFDALNVYLNPKEPERRAAIRESGVIDGLVRIQEACRAAGIAIFYGQGDHRADGKDFRPQIVEREIRGQTYGHPFLTVPRAATAGSWEQEVIAELTPRPEDYIVKKHRWSTFFQTHFELSLRTARIDTLMLAGGAIEVGLGSTAYSARDLNLNLIVLRDVCTSPDPEVKELFMTKVFPIFARVMTVDEAIAQFEPAGTR